MPENDIEMATDNTGAIVLVDLVDDVLDLLQHDLVLGAEIGTFGKFLEFFVQAFAPDMLVVQIEDVIDNMVLVQIQPQAVDKALMEGEIVRGELLVGLAALDRTSKASLVVDGDGIKKVVPDLDMLFAQKDIRIKALVEPIEIDLGKADDRVGGQRGQLDFSTVVEVGDRIIDRRYKPRNLHIQFAVKPLFDLFKRVDIFGGVQVLVQG